MKTNRYRESGEINPRALGELMAEIVSSKVFENWDDDADIAKKVEAIKACKENVRYLSIFESLINDAPSDSETAAALKKLVDNLKKYERSYLMDRRIHCI